MQPKKHGDMGCCFVRNLGDDNDATIVLIKLPLPFVVAAVAGGDDVEIDNLDVIAVECIDLIQIRWEKRDELFVICVFHSFLFIDGDTPKNGTFQNGINLNPMSRAILDFFKNDVCPALY